MSLGSYSIWTYCMPYMKILGHAYDELHIRIKSMCKTIQTCFRKTLHSHLPLQKNSPSADVKPEYVCTSK
jgi:hypothetical protein